MIMTSLVYDKNPRSKTFMIYKMDKILLVKNPNIVDQLFKESAYATFEIMLKMSKRKEILKYV